MGNDLHIVTIDRIYEWNEEMKENRNILIYSCVEDTHILIFNGYNRRKKAT